MGSSFSKKSNSIKSSEEDFIRSQSEASYRTINNDACSSVQSEWNDNTNSLRGESCYQSSEISSPRSIYFGDEYCPHCKRIVKEGIAVESQFKRIIKLAEQKLKESGRNSIDETMEKCIIKSEVERKFATIKRRPMTHRSKQIDTFKIVDETQKNRIKEFSSFGDFSVKSEPDYAICGKTMESVYEEVIYQTFGVFDTRRLIGARFTNYLDQDEEETLPLCLKQSDSLIVTEMWG